MQSCVCSNKVAKASAYLACKFLSNWIATSRALRWEGIDGESVSAFWELDQSL